MKRYKNYSLKNYNTFHIDVNAREFILVESNQDLEELFKEGVFKIDFLIIGEASDILFTKDFEGTVIKINTKGYKILEDTIEECIIESKSGEEWDYFVAKTLEHKAYGLENLSLIPGSVGASAVQNIGACGVEAREYIDLVRYFNIEDGKYYEIEDIDLEFSYRNSIFKGKLKNIAIITEVIFRLRKSPKIRTDYADIQNAIVNIENLSPEILRDKVIQIRKNKLHDPKEVGNAGSFFKNPIVEEEIAFKLQKDYPEMRINFIENNRAKLSAGWLIEQSGWKGWTSDNQKYGVSKKHALVLLNYSNANGSDIAKLSQAIKESVYTKFGIRLEEEVIIL